jgi:prepilin signal peptidase PulO-like enzyme (type II secretory pathway)
MELVLKILIYTIAGLLGSAIASFFHCVVVRRESGVSWRKGRSTCDECNKELSWFHTIPILSYAIQKGKSECCDCKLSCMHLFSEVFGLISFVLIAYSWSLGASFVELLTQLIVVLFAIYTFISDGKYMRVSVPISLLTGTVLVILSVYQGTFSNVFSAAIVGGGFFALQFLVTRGKGIGSGDVILGIIMGLALGIPGVIVAILASYVIGAVHAIYLIVKKRATRKTHIPLGAYLMIGMIIVLFFGESMRLVSILQNSL